MIHIFKREEIAEVLNAIYNSEPLQLCFGIGTQGSISG